MLLRDNVYKNFIKNLFFLYFFYLNPYRPLKKFYIK